MHTIYQQHLTSWFQKENRKPLILRGARQVGKSTLVRHFAKANGLELYEVNLEKHPLLEGVFTTLDIAKILQRLETTLEKSIPLHKGSLLFLDEIQATPHALAALRYFYEERPQLAVIAAGSLLEFALAEHDFSMPVGRIEYLFMEPVTFPGFLKANQKYWLLEQLEKFDMQKPFSEELHQKCVDEYAKYRFVGGMPEAVATFARGDSTIQDIIDIQNNILNTYEDDFIKYARKAYLDNLRHIFKKIPSQVGQKVIYAQLSKDDRASVVRNSVQMLDYARIIRRVFHTPASKIPIAAQADYDIFRIFMLDIGLLCRLLRVPYPLPEDDMHLLDSGPLAEQFVAQHLAGIHGLTENPSLFYWLRKGKAHNAEVDFVVQWGTKIVPIEVKAGTSGTLRSLQQFVVLHGSKVAVKLSLQMPSFNTVKHSVQVGNKTIEIEFNLASVPLYLVAWLPRILQNGKVL